MTSGGICPMGYYCPVGSSQPSACTPGMYCETPGLPLPTGADLDNVYTSDTLNGNLLRSGCTMCKISLRQTEILVKT